jgi:hypothetical protein
MIQPAAGCLTTPGNPVASWADFENQAPDFATAGRRLLIGSDGVAIGFLATVTESNTPRLSPVCPIFCGRDVYVSVGADTPKVRDLRARTSYVLHSFLGENDEEFQLSGTASQVRDFRECSTVHQAIPFAAFKRDDPIFRLRVERALWVYWERVGQPDTRAVRRRWRSPGGTV